MLWGMLGETLLLAEEWQLLRYQEEGLLRKLCGSLSCGGGCAIARQSVGTNCCMHAAFDFDAIEQISFHRVVLWLRRVATRLVRDS